MSNFLGSLQFLSPDNGGTEGGAKTIEGKGVGLIKTMVISVFDVFF